MTGKEQLRFWLITAGVFFFLIWALSPMLLPFVAGIAIAYFLNPVVELLEKRNISRGVGTAAALLGFIMIAVAMLLLIVPLVKSQLVALIEMMPAYVAQFREGFIPWLQGALKLSPADVERLRGAAGNHAGEAIGWTAELLKRILTSGFAIFDILSLVLITPLIAFYMLRDWKKMTGIVDSSLPRRPYPTIKEQLNRIDGTLAGFVRGQAIVCIALGVYYALSLTAINLNFGATVGIIAGILSFIPYVGTTFGWVTSLMLGAAQYEDPMMLGVILGIFVVGQIAEGYYLTPKLVGDRVGLHPVWVLFGLFAGGYLLGFLGVLIAVPVTAVFGVLIRFAMKQYRASKYYQDPETA